YLLAHPLERLAELLGLFARQDPLSREHARVGDAAAHVLAEERAVHVDRSGEALHARVGAALEARAPALSAGPVFLCGPVPSGGSRMPVARGCRKDRFPYPL